MTAKLVHGRLGVKIRDILKVAMQKRAPIFAGYEDALVHCPGGGYDSATIAAVVAAKTERLIADPELCETFLPPAGRAGIALTSVIAQLVRGSDHSVRVLDFGGACGAHYFAARRFAREAQFEWCVVETDAMIHQGRPMEDGSLRFAGSLTAAQELLGEVDLLHSSGTLQYHPEPEEALRQLIGVGAATLALTRLSLTEGEPFTIVQKSRLSHNGPGRLPPGFSDRMVAYPLTVLNRTHFEETVRQDYEIVACYRDESSDHITPRGRVYGSSYLCLRKPGN